MTGVTPESIAALIRPIRDDHYDYVAPMYQRHPLDGPLVTQLVRPLTRAAYGWQVLEPVAPEFGCSSRFVTHCLEQDVWDTDLGRVGVDLWVTSEALAKGFRCCQAGLTPHSPGPSRTGFGELFEQVVALEGSISGEHGIGFAKAKYLSLELDAAQIALLKRLKAAFDPHGILNPGKIFS